MPRTHVSLVAISALGVVTTLAHAELLYDSYTAAFDGSDDGSTLHGNAWYQTYNNEYSDLQLVNDGQPGTWGTWDSGIRRDIKSFNASFKFSFKQDAGGIGDGFSFLAGDLSDLSGTRAQGDERSINAFREDGAGISVGFDTYGADNETGIYDSWGGNPIAWDNAPNPSHYWNGATYQDYIAALQGGATANIDWDINTGLSVSISWIDNQGGWNFSTEFFTWPGGLDTSNWGFGFAARNGGSPMDVIIDDFTVDYSYEQIPAPGALALLGLGGLSMRRRRA